MKQAFEAIAQDLGEDPQDQNTTYGPIVDKIQYDKVRKYIESGKNSAELFAGGDEYQETGHYISPTIFINPADDAKIYKEEIFGPVLCVKSFETEEEALKMANDTQYGLAGKFSCRSRYIFWFSDFDMRFRICLYERSCKSIPC